MTRECHVRFCERLRGKLLRPTHHFGMKAHIGVDADSGAVHTVVGTAAHAHDVTQAHALLHGPETDVFADAGYQSVAEREEAQGLQVRWHVALRPDTRGALHKGALVAKLLDELERVKARIRARVERPSRVLTRQFGRAKTHYEGLAKNTAQITALSALANLWLLRRKLLALQG